jgi:thymidylate synthase (FAD)
VRFLVLDHGYVELIERWGSDEDIIEAARMSTGKGFQGWGTQEKPGDEKLMAYLWRNRHTSPFEQCGLTIEVQAPLMVFRDWHRHRTQSYNELSARYTQMPDLHYLPSAERIQAQSKKNKQGSEGVIPGDVKAEFLRRMKLEQEMIYDNYQWALDHGIAREIARLNTPVSRYSKMRASANLLNWLRFLGLRLDEGAQWEIRQYAEVLSSFIKELFPRTHELFSSQRL